MDKKNNINIGAMIKKLLERKGLMAKALVLAAIISAALILCVPRYYTCEVSLAPEFSNSATNGSLASIASSFGVNLASTADNDAISPSLYPDLMESKQFVVTLLPIRVKSLDGKIDTDYYTYLRKHQQIVWWTKMTRAITRSIKNLLVKPKPEVKSNIKHLDPFHLSEQDFKVTEVVSRNITCSVDRRNYVITIRVTDQDPLISASMADSVRLRLQQFITNYRTNKARVDVAYYKKLLNEAKADYKKALNVYSHYADSHRDMILQSYISERDELENDMQMKFNVVTALTQQYEAAKAKLQEATPAFTTLKYATVPVRPTGPKRVVFVLGMMIMTFFATAIYILKGKQIKELLKSEKKNKTHTPATAIQANTNKQTTTNNNEQRN